MKVLVVAAHPVETSFVAALHERAVTVLRDGGHEVDDCDLYAEGFDPVLSRQDRVDYHDTTADRSRVQPYIARLSRADALLFVHPVWNFGPPAILKGFLDRVFLPGVAFTISPDGNLGPQLTNIQRYGVVCTYGASRLAAILAGDPPRRFMRRGMRGYVPAGRRCNYLACHDMNHTTPERRAAFIGRVERVLQSW